MQTFLPYADPRRSAEVLDDRRLGKQRVETFQVLRALTWPQYGWKHHPAVRMWRGFVPALVAYGVACVDEWRARGHADATRAALLDFAGGVEQDWDALHDAGLVPPWVGDELVHLSHRSALLRKDRAHYESVFGEVPDDLPYVWPDPVFPRWPIRRVHGEPLAMPEAARLLGLDGVPPGAGDAVARLSDGKDAQVTSSDPPSSRTIGLLAGLCTPGSTVWVVDLPPLERTGPAPSPREGTGSVSGSIAREPTPADREAMMEEFTATPEFHFLRTGLATRGLADDLGAGLLVAALSADPGPDLGRPRLLLP